MWWDIKRRRPCEDGGRDCSKPSTSQGASRTASNRQKLGDRLGRVRPWRLHMKPAWPTPWSWTSGLQNCGKIDFCCLNHPICIICYDSHRKRIHKLNRSTPISRNWTQSQMWPCGLSRGMRAGYPSLPRSPLGQQGPQESLVGGARSWLQENLPSITKRGMSRVSGQDRKPLSGRRSSQAPLMLKHQHLGSTGNENKKTLKKTVGKRTIQ